MFEKNDIQTGFAEVNGTKLYYEITGTGHPLVLIHGGFVNRNTWDDQFNVFAQQYKVIRYDVRGYGDSALVTADTKPYSDYDDLYHLLRFLGIEKTYLLGLSLGGGIAIDFTLEHPEMVNALLPVSTGLSGFDFATSFKGDPIETAFAEMEKAFETQQISHALDTSLHIWTDGPARTPDQVDPMVRDRVRSMTAHNWARGDDENTQPQTLEPPACVRLADIATPMLVIVGDQGLPAILTIADLLKEKVRDARVVIIPDTAHHLNMEKPAEFNQIVLAFLDTVR